MTAKEENLPLLKWIQDQGSSGTDQYFEYTFTIGMKNEFTVRIKGGTFGNSEPDEMLGNLADYEKLNIQLFEGQRLAARGADNLDLWKMELAAIYPETDYRFSSQSWALQWNLAKSKFNKSGTVSYLMASPDTVCDIVRHCQKLVGMKAFW